MTQQFLEFRWSPTVPEEQYSHEFIQGMLNRMMQGYHKYGPRIRGETDWLASLKQRIVKYEETGNTEWLMDSANYAMLEFMDPQHPDAHFRATESGESPGHTTRLGEVRKDSAYKPHTFHKHEGD